MGNTNSSGGGGIGRRRHRRRNSPVAPPPEMQIPGNQYGFESATPYPAQFPNPNPNPISHQFYQYPGYYQPSPTAMPIPPPPPYDHPHHQYNPWAAGGRHSYGPLMPPPLPYVEHQKAVTIRNDVNLMKDTLRLEHDEENPGKFLVSFTFNATVSGRITVIFFAKEGEECNLTGAKAEILAPVTVNFQQGLSQKFRQPSGTGIELSAFEESELLQKAETEIYPLAVKAEGIQVDNSSGTDATNSQITLAVFEKEKHGVFKVRVVKQILWVNGMRYELQEIYGIENSVEDDNSNKSSDASEQGKECVICLSEPRDTTVLPCRHMCLCSGCAKVLRFQTNRCPICRQPVERLLEIKVKNNGGDK